MPSQPISPQEVVYGTGGGRDLHLDLFLPDASTRNGAGIVFMHGGGWSGGTRTQYHPQSRHFAEKGYVCACIEYRFSGEAIFPAAIEDSKCAVRWMRAKAEQFGLDEERICVSGGSAGGHLAAMVALTDVGAFEGEGGWANHSSAANLAVLFNPACDFTRMVDGSFAVDALEQFVGSSFAEAPERFAEASPITYVSASAPPTLALHGTADVTVPFDDSENLVARLWECGAEAELFTADGAPHGFFNTEPWYTPTVEAMESFLKEHFG